MQIIIYYADQLNCCTDNNIGYFICCRSRRPKTRSGWQTILRPMRRRVHSVLQTQNGTSVLKQSDRIFKLFENSFPNTLDTTVKLFK